MSVLLPSQEDWVSKKYPALPGLLIVTAMQTTFAVRHHLLVHPVLRRRSVHNLNNEAGARKG